MVVNRGEEPEKAIEKKRKIRNSSKNIYLQVLGNGNQQIRKLEGSYTREK